jgi:MoaA/NifB/PqqE/SkfB family radical SAM enzyme
MEISCPRYSLTTVLIEILWGCNLRCTLCGVRNTRHQRLPAAKIEEIIAKLPTVKILNIIGHGEPLLHPEWLAIMDIARRYGLGLQVVTNGMLLTEEKIMSLPQNTTLIFSIDSINPDIYRTMRPGGDLVKVLSNIVQLMKLRPDVNRLVNSIVTKQTYDHVEEMAMFCRDHGLSLNLLYPSLKEKEHKEYYPDRPHPLKNRTVPNRCTEPFTSMMIGMNGDIYACCYMYGSKDKENPQDYFDEYVEGKNNRVFNDDYKLGNIYTDDPYALWNMPKMQKIRGTIQDSYSCTKGYNELRDEIDVSKDYCRICGVRWGKRC